MENIRTVIDDAFSAQRQGSEFATTEVIEAVNEAIDLLDQGKARVAEPTTNGWKVNEWLKKAVLLSFVLSENKVLTGGGTRYFDKVPGKFDEYDYNDFAKSKVRVVPPAMVRKGAHISPNAVLMPSYVNIGAWVGDNTMVDTWATVGSCAQIGSNVHLSGGVGIGGVLEPLQASPTIIEDNCFIGARSEIVEGVVVARDSVISMGVYIGQSTRILNRQTNEITYGYVPPGSVVVSGSIPADDGSHSLYCAVIVKQVDDKTRAKVGINELLRDI
ncbi:MAG: 2,3,4,5-tetrahydropyridine-2,6-dicarboxylate N-succinyltransferase [Acidiferrobacteraceae bacterium]|nr:2,3,4,5-tetrahydropyridine-2,6-dicarboxylate N-succinyltransferase [Acidiferrobacteraceae bacterium]